MASIKVVGLGNGVTTSVGPDGTLTITVPEPPAPPLPPAAPVALPRPLRIGYHPNPAEYKTWFAKLPAPWFTRIFHPPGKGLPVWGGPAISLLPTGTIPHISFKDRVAPAIINTFLDSIPAPSTEVWLTWHHEGDIDFAADVDGYTNYWKLVRQTVDAHPTRPKITLVNVHTNYASRYKRSAMDWRRFVLPDCADVDSWDCYRPASPDVYEDPASLLGIALAAQREFQTRTHITEYGTHPTSWDTDGAAQATWYRESCQLMNGAGVEACGFWCNVDGAYEYRPTKPKVLAEWTSLIKTYNAVRTP